MSSNPESSTSSSNSSSTSRPSTSTSTSTSAKSSSSSNSKQPQRTTKETHPNLPPGLILDAEGKVCKVCNSWQDWGKMRVKKKSGATGEPSGESAGGTKGKGQGMGGFASMAGFATASKTKSPQNPDRSAETPTTTTTTMLNRDECPADTAALGRSTWTFLHTTAAYYPLSAPVAMQNQMRNLLSSLSILYPCTPCAEDFQDKVKETPPDLTGREGLSRWLCERHNEVNMKLGKERFDCDWTNLNKRWKDGPEDGSCD